MREAVLLNTLSFQVPLTGDGWDSRDAGCARLSSSGFLALTKQLQKGFQIVAAAVWRNWRGNFHTELKSTLKVLFPPQQSCCSSCLALWVLSGNQAARLISALIILAF